VLFRSYDLLADNLIAAHVVQVNNQDIALLKDAGVAVAHCPSSNITLKCGRAPLEKFLANKIPVGLGTDSAASSNNLSLLSEANMAIELHKSYKTDLVLNAQQAIALVTIKAAECLGLDDKLGSLEPGKWADVGVFTLQKNSITGKPVLNPYESLVQGLCQLEDLFVNGQSVYRN
jgi:5-methylthioadenosine/S-adenosylhomocysteine deaminase